jgi:CRISPR/Cas system-associated exonuclease Cas4 (RecB family)
MSTNTDDLIFEPTDEELEEQDAIQSAFSLLGVRHVSASSIGMYQRCPRQWAYRYVLGIKVPPDGGLITGLGVHRAAEVVVDWKTSGKSPNADEHIQSVQTELYALATGKPLTYTFLVDLKSGVKVADVEIDQAQAAHAARFATDTVAEVARGMALGIWPRTRKGWHCSKKWCGYWDRCISNPGRDDATINEKAAEARAAAGVMW